MGFNHATAAALFVVMAALAIAPPRVASDASGGLQMLASGLDPQGCGELDAICCHPGGQAPGGCKQVMACLGPELRCRACGGEGEPACSGEASSVLDISWRAVGTPDGRRVVGACRLASHFTRTMGVWGVSDAWTVRAAPGLLHIDALKVASLHGDQAVCLDAHTQRL
jgi:hypothetical protein